MIWNADKKNPNRLSL